MADLFERLRIEGMVREWCEADLRRGNITDSFVDGLVSVLRLRLRRADPDYRDESPAARAALVAIADARGIIEDRQPLPSTLSTEGGEP